MLFLGVKNSFFLFGTIFWQNDLISRSTYLLSVIKAPEDEGHETQLKALHDEDREERSQLLSQRSGAAVQTLHAEDFNVFWNALKKTLSELNVQNTCFFFNRLYYLFVCYVLVWVPEFWRYCRQRCLPSLNIMKQDCTQFVDQCLFLGIKTWLLKKFLRNFM